MLALPHCTKEGFSGGPAGTTTVAEYLFCTIPIESDIGSLTSAALCFEVHSSDFGRGLCNRGDGCQCAGGALGMLCW